MSYRVWRDDIVICSALCGHKVTRSKARDSDEESAMYEVIEQFYALPNCWNKAWKRELLEGDCCALAQEVKVLTERLREEIKRRIPVIRIESAE
jgi:hypothetical protein